MTSTSPVQVAYDSAGNAIAVYSRYLGSSPDELYVRERPPGGPWGSPQLVPLNPPLGSYIRDLVVDRNEAGDVVVAFRSGGIHALRRPAGGSWSSVTSWSSPGSSGPGSGCPAQPAVDVGEDGTAAVAWSPTNSCNGVVTNWRVLAAAFVPGSGWETTPQIWDTSEADRHSWPGVVVADDGTVTVVFGSADAATNYSEWKVDRSPAGTWGSPTMLTFAGSRETPALATRGAVTAATWPGGGGEVAVIRDGNGWGPAQTLPFPGTPENQQQSVAVDGSGTVYVASAVVDGGSRRVHVASHSPSGSWTDTAITPVGENASTPVVAANAAGDVVLAWGKYVGGDQVGMAALRPAGGSWPAAAQQISSTTGSNVAARVAVDRFGHALAVVTPFTPANNIKGDVILETRDPAAADPGSPPTVSPSSAGVGDTLTCTPGAFFGTPPFRYTYEWYSNGSLISGATAATYETTPDDADADVGCRVTGTNEAGSDSAGSNLVTVTGGDENFCDITQDHSIDGATEVNQPIVNDTDATVQIYWLDYNGHRQLYFTLGPNETWDHDTFLTHPWLMLDADTGECVGYTLAYEGEYHITHTVPHPADTDGDGLLDTWETNGIDADGDGTIDLALNLPPYNADPLHKDVYVEVDYMAAPQAGTLNDVTAAFSAAPVYNPDSIPGVRLHAMLGEAVPTYASVCFWDCVNFPAPASFATLKSGTSAPCDGYFGSAAERSSGNCEAVLAARRLAFRYAIFGQSYSERPGSSGVGELPGNDLMVTVAGKTAEWIVAAGGLRSAEAGTLMHELGHTLGLGHGGGDDVNCKPNYQSVMSYSYQVPNFDFARPLDYSREELPALFEGSLDEPFGTGATSGTVVFGVDGAPQVIAAGGPVDWDDDGAFDFGVSADVNYILRADGTPLCDASPDELLDGHDDWASLLYNFRLTDGFANGVADPPPPAPTPELTSKAALEAAKAADSDGDGANNASESVCNTTRAYVQGSAKYQNAKPQDRKTADSQVANACSSVEKITKTTKPQQKKGLIAAYKDKVDSLRSGGWLTAAQATTLKAMVDTL